MPLLPLRSIVLVEVATNGRADRTIHQCVAAGWSMGETYTIANSELALPIRQKKFRRRSVLNDGASEFVVGRSS